MPLTSDRPALIRLTDARYGDGIGTPFGGVDPVIISNGLFDQDGDMPNSAGLSNLFVAWGQFMDHDLSLSPENHAETIAAPGLVAPLERSEVADGTGIDSARLPVNAITWQIDGSQIYGSTDSRTDDLRAFEDGKMRMASDATSDKGLMPDAAPDTFMAGDISSDDPVFLAGDVRANENPALSSVHTLMVRDHNYWAARLAEEHPAWNDDQLFEGARQIVEYTLQKVTYDEWLPHLIGDAAGPDTGFDPTVDGQIAVEFSTAAFRFGHTMVSSTLERQNEDGTTAEGGDLDIRNAFFNPDIIKDYGIDAILRGQASSDAQELDTKVIDDLNFFLQTPGGLSGFSLVGLNLLRGQDHGLQSYVDTRAALIGDIDPATLDPTDFSIISSDPAQQAALAAVYPTVHDVDLWVGGLAEDPIDGTQFGQTFTLIVGDQFARTRAADDTFGDLDPALGDAIIAEVRDTSLQKVILRNTDIDTLQEDPFLTMQRGLTDIYDVAGTPDDDTIDLVALNITGAVTTGAGDDTVTVTGGTTVRGDVALGLGSDSFTQTSGSIDGSLYTGHSAHDGGDIVTIGGTARVVGGIYTSGGADTITLDGGAEVIGTIYTGMDDDTVTIGSRVTASGIVTQTGSDKINLSYGADVGKIDGGEDADGSDFDVLCVTGGPFRVDYAFGDPFSERGDVVFLDSNGQDIGRVAFRNIESVTCFTPGTRLITATGTARIEDISVGDKIYTLDNGLQPVRWIGRTRVPAQGPFAPIHFAAGAFGNIRPMSVSPQHRMMVSDWRCDMICGADEVLIPAKHLVNNQTIWVQEGGMVDYIHILFDDHQIVLADGIPSESFHPGRTGLGAMSEDTRAEILALFPQLARDLDSFGPAARYTVKPHEARLINRLT
ncbi:peroxidase family protein [Yoonia sp. 208BN28-4]|uniref:peroxidase family protein n=1 Tax=Yoonia sp. 208BN28-4 TaxID=3126505 RepID=UPI0030B725CA